MAKDKPESPPTEATISEDIATAPDRVAREAALDRLAATPADQLSEAFNTPVSVDSKSKVWEVDIPGCLIGKRFVAARNEAEAGEKYKAPAGITTHTTPLTVTPCEFTAGNLPEGVELFG